jgi:hypothetical protein
MEVSVVVIGSSGIGLDSEFVSRVFQWRGNDVLSARPFAQVDGAAAFAAERELGVGAFNRFLADWTP